MNHIPTPTALDQAEAWLGRCHPLSPATFGAAEALHSLCDIDGIEIRAMADDESTALWAFRRGDFAGDTWLFHLLLGDRRGSLSVRASTELPHGRAFLANLLCDAYTPLDADHILQWWRTASDDRPCTVTVTLPSSAAEVCDLFTQLERAAHDASIADLSGWGTR